MTYFIYEIPNSKTKIVSMEQASVLEAVLEYLGDKEDPQRVNIGKGISTVKKLSLDLAYPSANPEEYITVKLKPSIELKLNANAYDPLLKLVKGYDDYLSMNEFGRYIRLDTGKEGTWLLPPYVMQAIKEHDWNQYEPKMRAWQSARQTSPTSLEELAKADKPSDSGSQ
jgi:hypothetical protein